MANLIPLFAAITPFVLWPIELILPYPHVLEEAAKTLLLLAVLNSTNRIYQIKMAVIIGLLFAFSESVLYLFNIYLAGDITTLLVRFAFTIPLHLITTLTILVPAMINRKLIIVGLIIAVFVHYFFNQLIASQ